MERGSGGSVQETEDREAQAKADDAAAEAQNGWVTLGLYAIGVAIYASLGQIHPGWINFPPLMLLCVLGTGWFAPIAWRRLRR